MNENGNPEHAAPDAKPFQFSLQSLLVVFTVVALFVGLIMCGPVGVLCLLLIIILAAAYRQMWKTAALFVLPLLGMLFYPAVYDSREAARRMQCANNLKQLGAALRNYHDVYGSFPPACVTDKNGQPMHSWRVLILPFLDHEDLYNKYRFDEPWNGPHNRQLEQSMPHVFHCPSQPKDGHPYATSYVAVVGPSTAWHRDRPVEPRDIRDGTSNTLLLVETADSDIHWMEPRDLEYPSMPAAVNPPSQKGISSHHYGIAQVLFADGSVDCLSEDAPEERVEAWLSIQGGERVSREGF